MANHAVHADALRTDIAHVIFKATAWVPMTNRVAPDIGPATWETLTFEPRASGYGFEVKKEKDRQTVDVTILRGKERLPFGHLAASIEACLNKVYSSPGCIQTTARDMYHSVDPRVCLRKPTTETEAYLAERFRHVDTGKTSDLHTFLCAVVDSGYDGITRVMRTSFRDGLCSK